MRLNKLSHKSINSWLLLAALFAPIVYLFGALFTTQLGAHGAVVLNEPVYVEEYVDVDSPVIGNNYSFTFDFDSNFFPDYFELGVFTFDFSWNGVDCDWVDFAANNQYRTMRVHYADNSSIKQVVLYYLDTGVYQYSYTQPPFVFVVNPSNSSFLSFFGYVSSHSSYTLGVLSLVPTDSDSGSLSDYLFKDFFAKDNFLAQSGRNVIEGTANYGFQPMGELIRFTDANMLHLANLEYGYLMIGYAYYAIHVIFVDLIVYLTLFIPRLIRGLVDRLEGGVDL